MNAMEPFFCYMTEVHNTLPEEVDFGQFYYQFLDSETPVGCPIEAPHLQTFLETVAGTKGRHAAVHLRSGMYPFFRFLHEWGEIPLNPLDESTFKARPRALEPRAVLSQEELERLETTVRMKGTRQDLVWLLLVSQTFLRPGETLTLQVKEIDFARHRIEVPAEKAKARRAGYCVMNGKVAEELRACLHEKVITHDPEAFVLANRDGKPLSSWYFEYRLKSFLRAAAIDKPVTPHCLRHTGATLLGKAHVPLTVIQQLMRHAKPTTTLIYERSWEESEVLKALDLNPLVGVIEALWQRKDVSN